MKADYDVLYVSYCVAGVHGFLANGTMGGFAFLTSDDKIRKKPWTRWTTIRIKWLVACESDVRLRLGW
jgi:hypothetical protein